MPTVTMTSDLEHYVESLRSFLDRNPSFKPLPASPKIDPGMAISHTDSGSGSVQSQDRRLTPETTVEQAEQWKPLSSTQKNYESLR